MNHHDEDVALHVFPGLVVKILSAAPDGRVFRFFEVLQVDGTTAVLAERLASGKLAADFERDVLEVAKMAVSGTLPIHPGTISGAWKMYDVKKSENDKGEEQQYRSPTAEEVDAPFLGPVVGLEENDGNVQPWKRVSALVTAYTESWDEIITTLQGFAVQQLFLGFLAGLEGREELEGDGELEELASLVNGAGGSRVLLDVVVVFDGAAVMHETCKRAVESFFPLDEDLLPEFDVVSRPHLDEHLYVEEVSDAIVGDREAGGGRGRGGEAGGAGAITGGSGASSAAAPAPSSFFPPPPPGQAPPTSGLEFALKKEKLAEPPKVMMVHMSAPGGDVRHRSAILVPVHQNLAERLVPFKKGSVLRSKFLKLLEQADYHLPLVVSFAIKQRNGGKADSQLLFYSKLAHTEKYGVDAPPVDTTVVVEKCDTPFMTIMTDAGSVHRADAAARAVAHMQNNIECAALSGAMMVLPIHETPHLKSASTFSFAQLANIALQSLTIPFGVPRSSYVTGSWSFARVLPGPFAVFRYDSLVNTRDGGTLLSVLHEFYRVVQEPFTDKGILAMNAINGEDALLTHLVFTRGVWDDNGTWHLGAFVDFLPHTLTFIDFEDAVTTLVKQRRRWSNVTFAVIIFLLQRLLQDIGYASEYGLHRYILTVVDTILQLFGMLLFYCSSVLFLLVAVRAMPLLPVAIHALMGTDLRSNVDTRLEVSSLYILATVLTTITGAIGFHFLFCARYRHQFETSVWVATGTLVAVLGAATWIAIVVVAIAFMHQPSRESMFSYLEASSEGSSISRDGVVAVTIWGFVESLLTIVQNAAFFGQDWAMVGTFNTAIGLLFLPISAIHSLYCLGSITDFSWGTKGGKVKASDLPILPTVSLQTQPERSRDIESEQPESSLPSKFTEVQTARSAIAPPDEESNRYNAAIYKVSGEHSLALQKYYTAKNAALFHEQKVQRKTNAASRWQFAISSVVAVLLVAMTAALAVNHPGWDEIVLIFISIQASSSAFSLLGYLAALFQQLFMHRL